MKKHLSKLNKIDICFFFVFIASLIFLFYKIQFGYANVDEQFYLTVSYRLAQGDRPFKDEWFLGQTSNFITAPLVGMYYFFTKTTDGILLNFRRIYIITLALVSLVIYLRLKKESKVGSAVASISLLLFAPRAISALSYNSNGIIFLSLSLTIFFTAEKNKKLEFLLSGVFLALAILCCPYLIILCVIYTFIVIFVYIREKISKNKITDERLKINNWVFVFLGSLIILIICLVYILHDTTISSLIININEMLKDPTHPHRTAIQVFNEYFSQILFQNSVSFFAFFIYFLVIIFSTIDKSKNEHKIIYYGMSIFAFLLMFLPVTRGADKDIDLIMLPMNFLTLIIFILEKEKINKNLIAYFWLPGIIYTYAISWGSDTKILAISLAATVPLIASIIVIFQSIENNIKEKKTSNKLIAVGLILCIVLQLSSEIYLRYGQIYWETFGMKDEVVKIEEGPQKGIYVTEQKEKFYSSRMEDIKYCEKIKKFTNIMYYSNDCGNYLFTPEAKTASLTAWINHITEDSLNTLSTYYKMNPKKIPTEVYIENATDTFGYTFDEEKVAEYYINKFGMKRIDTPSGNIFLYK